MSRKTIILGSREPSPDPAPIPPVEIKVFLSGAAFLALVPYPIIVERWQHLYHRAPLPERWSGMTEKFEQRLTGSLGRKYAAEFNEAEQATLLAWYHKFRKWHLHEGTPDQIELSLAADVPLLQRAVHFFATH